jgi:hypothetical protein
MLIVLFAIAPSAAWVVQEDDEGNSLVWDEFPIVWELNTENAPLPDDQLDELFGEAFETWQVPDTQIAFTAGGHSGKAVAEDDGVNSVYFDDEWEHAPLLGLTTLWATKSDGEVRIFDFDIALDANADWATDGSDAGFDLLSTMVHEAGHGLGLGHTTIVEASMYEDSMPGETHKRTLHDDDIDAMRVLYSLFDEDEDADPPGFLRCSHGTRGGFWLLPALLVGYRRRQQPAQ